MEKKGFEEDKNATKLDIDLNRKFVVLKKNNNFKVGDIIKICEDDNTRLPWFDNITQGKTRKPIHWKNLAYADEDEPIKFKAGDKVRIIKASLNSYWYSNKIGEIYTVLSAYGSGNDIMIDLSRGIDKNDCELVEEGKEIKIGTKVHSDWWDFGKTLPDSFTSRSSGYYTGYYMPTLNHNKKHNKKGNKFMGIIKNTFKSKENKALNHFELIEGDGTLNSRGRDEFIDYLYENLKEERKGFITKIVEAYKEEKDN